MLTAIIITSLLDQEKYTSCCVKSIHDHTYDLNRSKTERKMSYPSKHTTSFQRLQDVYTMSPTSYTRVIDVEMMLFVYWDGTVS